MSAEGPKYFGGPKAYERVWDPLVRLGHWTMVIAFATAWLWKSNTSLHAFAGQVILFILIVRLCWGIVGPATARFENFMTGPVTAIRYLGSVIANKPKHYVGHNPAGAAMIGLLILSLFILTLSGILMSTTAYWGDAFVEWVHGAFAYVTLGLIVGHVAGVVLASFQHRENLPLAMIDGKKAVRSGTLPYEGPTQFSARRIILASSVAALGFGGWQLMAALFDASYWRMEKHLAFTAKKLGCPLEIVDGPMVDMDASLNLTYMAKATDNVAPYIVRVPLSIALQAKPKWPFVSNDVCPPKGGKVATAGEPRDPA
jgi:cytochrome b